MVAMIQAELSKWGYHSQSIHDWERVVEAVHQGAPQLIIMDITLPRYDGFYWTRRIREQSPVPILFLSAKELDPNAVQALALGADDYLEKPFSLNVLIAKVNALLRRRSLTSETQFADFQLNPITLDLTCPRGRVRLTPTEAVLIKILFRQPGMILSKQQLMDLLWDADAYIDENVLNVNLSRLRKKTRSLGLGQLIVTIRGRGYQLNEP